MNRIPSDLESSELHRAQEPLRRVRRVKIPGASLNVFKLNVSEYDSVHTAASFLDCGDLKCNTREMLFRNVSDSDLKAASMPLSFHFAVISFSPMSNVCSFAPSPSRPREVFTCVGFNPRVILAEVPLGRNFIIRGS